MATTFKLWNDSAMTDEFDFAGGDKIITDANGDFRLYFGSTDATRKVEESTSPGINNILLTPTDSAPGSGHEASEIKLATTQGGLTGASSGAALSLGQTINGGTAVEFWIRLTDSTGGGNPSTELSVQFSALVESTII